MTITTSIEDEPNSEFPEFRLQISSSADDLRVVDHSAMQVKRNISVALTRDDIEQLREQVDEVIDDG